MFNGLWNLTKKLSNLLFMMSISLCRLRASTQKGFHFVYNENCRGLIHSLLEKIRYPLARLMDIGTTDSSGIDIEYGPIKIFNESLYCIGFSTTRRTLQNEGSWERNVHCGIIFRVFYNINDMIYKECLQLMAPW